MESAVGSNISENAISMNCKRMQILFAKLRQDKKRAKHNNLKGARSY